MVEISRELDQRIYGDVYERLVSLPAEGVPPDVARMIEMRRAIITAEEAVTAAQNALPIPDMIARMAAEDQRTAAEDAFVQHVEEMHNAGRLEAALSFVENSTPERPEVIAAQAEQERLAQEAADRAAAEAARFVPQVEEAARPQIYMNADFALAGLLMEVRRDLPTDPATYANNPIIQTLVAANAQGEDAYYAAAQTIVQQHFASGELDRSLYALQDQTRSTTFAATATAEGYQRTQLMNTYLERLAGIPVDATDVPPSMTNLVALARDLHAMRTAPEGTHTAEAIEAKTFDYLQEGTQLMRQQVPIGTFLQERYPNGFESVANYIGAVPEVAWNNPGVLLQSAENLVGSTIGLTGDVLDLADAGTRYAGWGSLKEGVGLDGATMYGDVVRDTVVGGLDFVTGTPTIRENTNDQLVMDGTEVAGDIAIIVGSLGTAGLAKAGIRTGANIVRHTADDVAEVVIPRTADEFAAAAVAQTTDDAAAIVAARTAAATTTVNTTVDLAATAASLGQLVRPLADIAERTAMGIKNLFIRSATGILDDAASVAARNADAVAPSLLSQPVTRGGLAAMTAAPIVIGTGIAATEVATGGAVSEAVMDGTIASMRALIASGAINAQNLETSIDAIGFITELGNAMDKSAQNGAVNAVLHAGDPQSPETIALAKNTAIGWLLRPDNAASIIAAHGIRSQLVDDIIPDQNAADRYLAEAFIDNIVSRSHVNALGDNQITREDVRQHIESIFANPNNPLGSALRGGRLENGLRQIWPDFQAEPATAPVVPTEAFNQNAQPQEQNVIAATGMRWKGHLDSLATNLGQIQGLAWLSPIIGLIAAVVGMVAEMFQSNSTVAQTDNPERLAALGRTLGQPPGTVARVDHDGTPQDPITTGPERHLPLQPGLTPALQ